MAKTPKRSQSASRRLFLDATGQTEFFEKSVEQEALEAKPVECLGMTFPSDEARREYFLGKLRERLKDPEFRKIEGFPIGEDEDILRMSDPPYYTACPNPFLQEFVLSHGRPYSPGDTYDVLPLCADVAEGKNDPIYRIPSYYTKVPPRAIVPFVLHYTRPGDVILDAFCGSGMTGVAVELADRADTAERLPRTPGRLAILGDLSPTASFTASMMNRPLPASLRQGRTGVLGQFITSVLAPLYSCEWPAGSQSFSYAIWSEWGLCDSCNQAFCLFDAVIDWKTPETRAKFPCPNCRAILESASLKRAFSHSHDPWIGHTVRMARTSMVLLSKTERGRLVRRTPTDADIRQAELASASSIRLVPGPLPLMHMTHQRNNLPQYWGITHFHHFYTPRNYLAIDRFLAAFSGEAWWSALFAFLSVHENGLTRRNRFYVDKRRPHGSPIGPLSHTLYVPSLQVETNVAERLLAFLDEATAASEQWHRGHSPVTTQSATNLSGIPSNAVDFVFTDPPFGGNINYSEQSSLAESWFRVRTNNRAEAITNPVQGKGNPEYQELMAACFREYFRVLKPARYMVVEFHNSSNVIWLAIQRALEGAGFVVSSVNVLDKKQTTLHQDHKPTAMSKDLLITAYKPRRGPLGSVIRKASAESMWEFVDEHLSRLQVPRVGPNGIEIVRERFGRSLYDRVVASFVQQGLEIPLSSAEFLEGIDQRWPTRDGMFFLDRQVSEYDRIRVRSMPPAQGSLFVVDEETAIAWLQQELATRPRRYQEILPTFQQVSRDWSSRESPRELKELLNENFLEFHGGMPVPASIHSSLSRNHKELRGREKDDPVLISEALGRWYVPDARKEAELLRMRERTLLREFQAYANAKERRLRVFRIEALRVGFRTAVREGRYEVVTSVARKIPEEVLLGDPQLPYFFDVAVLRLGKE